MKLDAHGFTVLARHSQGPTARAVFEEVEGLNPTPLYEVSTVNTQKTFYNVLREVDYNRPYNPILTLLMSKRTTDFARKSPTAISKISKIFHGETQRRRH